jgi:phosphomannomutase
MQHPESPEKPLAGLHILVDAGNGAGGFFVADVLQKLGADTMGSQFLEPDGSFPNHVPNPEDPAAMAATIDAVNKSGADLGVVFDTDVDRSGVVDCMGRAVNKNKLIALMAAITLRDAPESTIVTDSVTSSGLTRFIASLGGKHLR